MTKQERSFNKIVKRALKNGWRPGNNYELVEEDATGENLFSYNSYDFFEEIIFSHKFAKAFWPSVSCFHNGYAYRHPAACPKGEWEWQYHLQNLALTPDDERLAYLSKYLEDHD